jgi:predicted dehydrogenase
MRRTFLVILVSAALAINNIMAQTNATRFRLMTLDPGHFHASLVQKFMYDDVDPVVHVYAPDGDDLAEHLKRIERFNTRTDQPTHWREEIYSQPDFFEKMLADKPGNIVVLAGKSVRKTDYILRSVQAGLNVLSDKPMVVRPEDFPRLQEAFAVAASNHVLLYDIMTERYEITTLLQREFSRQLALFGQWEKGTPESPAVVMESVHYISKIVAGAPLKRPPWFFDVSQTGEGITDVTTHLVDLVQFEAFPEIALSPADVTVINARRWTTPLTRLQFEQVTGATNFPAYLQPYMKNGVLEYDCNGAFTWRLRDIYAKISVVWEFEPPPGGGDALHSVLRGTRAILEIRQGPEQNYKPVLYVEKTETTAEQEFEAALRQAVKVVTAKYPGVVIRKAGSVWEVVVPDKYDVGHEAHFAQVTENYLSYLRAGRLPDWEVAGMLTKYATIMRADELSQ